MDLAGIYFKVGSGSVVKKDRIRKPSPYSSFNYSVSVLWIRNSGVGIHTVQ